MITLLIILDAILGLYLLIAAGFMTVSLVVGFTMRISTAAVLRDVWKSCLFWPWEMLR
jgi:hypothetical protein